MKTMSDLQSALKASFPAAQLSIDAPTQANGSYFIDFRLGARHATIEWVAGSTFGLSLEPRSDSDFGSGPSEVLASFEVLLGRLREASNQ
jgi:hypothetical protein